MEIVQFKDYNFSYPSKKILHNINLTVNQGDFVLICGPSGCGKTTLLNAIGGLDKVHNGNIYINGEKITGRRSGKIDKIRTLNVGYIFQNYNLVENMTVFDNVAIALKMTGVKNQKEIEEKVNYLTHGNKDVNIVFTGGEPTLQLKEDEPLLEGYFRAIETNGTNKVPSWLDWITCSPKSDIDFSAITASI